MVPEEQSAGVSLEEYGMANILRKVTVSGKRNQWGQLIWHAEAVVEHDGREGYASFTDYIGLYYFYITNQPVMRELRRRDMPKRTQEIKSFMIQFRSETDVEEKMAHTGFYSVLLYLYSLRKTELRDDTDEPVEYTEDIGKDTDEMELALICPREKYRAFLFREPYPDYTVVNIRYRMFDRRVIRPLYAEAYIIDHMKPVYLEAHWTPENPDIFTFEVNGNTIYELINRPHLPRVRHLAEIRAKGMFYKDMQSALEGRYGRACLVLISTIAYQLRAVEFHKRNNYDPKDIPEWIVLDPDMHF